MCRDLMVPREILCGRCHRVCRVTNWETWKDGECRRGLSQDFLQGNGMGWVSLDLCVIVCVIVDLRCTGSTLQLILWLQLHRCGAGRPIGIALLVCFPSASWIMSL